MADTQPEQFMIAIKKEIMRLRKIESDSQERERIWLGRLEDADRRTQRIQDELRALQARYDRLMVERNQWKAEALAFRGVSDDKK